MRLFRLILSDVSRLATVSVEFDGLVAVNSKNQKSVNAELKRGNKDLAKGVG